MRAVPFRFGGFVPVKIDPESKDENYNDCLANRGNFVAAVLVVRLRQSIGVEFSVHKASLPIINMSVCSFPPVNFMSFR